MAKPAKKVSPARKPMRMMRKQGTRGGRGCSTSTMMIVVVGILILGLIMYFSTMWNEKFNSNTTNYNCPKTIKYNGKSYDYMPGHGYSVEKTNDNNIGCEKFPLDVCFYAGNCTTKQVKGKKLGSLWVKSPECGRVNHEKSFEFCDKDDLIQVNFKDINDPRKRQAIYVGKAEVNPNDLNNVCLKWGGISKDNTKLDNGSLRYLNTTDSVYSRCNMDLTPKPNELTY